MGFTPAQVNQMSMWQWFAALHGYIEANSPKEANKLSEAEAEDLFDWIEQDAGATNWLTTQTYWWDGDWPEPDVLIKFNVL